MNTRCVNVTWKPIRQVRREFSRCALSCTSYLAWACVTDQPAERAFGYSEFFLDVAGILSVRGSGPGGFVTERKRDKTCSVHSSDFSRAT